MSESDWLTVTFQHASGCRPALLRPAHCVCVHSYMRTVFALPLHPDVDLASVHTVEEALHERGPLQGEGCDQEVEAHAAEAVALQEGHEEAEADEDHHVHVLETCTTWKTLSKIMEIMSQEYRSFVSIVVGDTKWGDG